MSEWRAVRLGNLIDVHHGYAFKGEHFADDGPDVLLTPKNFHPAGGLDTSPQRCKRYDGPVDAQFVLEAGDIVIAMTDLMQAAPILGAAGRVPETGRYLHNQRIGKVVVTDADSLVPEFVPWLLNSPHVRSQVRATATGSTVRHTAPTRIKEISVVVPSLETQRRIAGLLDSFDELIALNERRVLVLERLARALHHEWFERLRYPGATVCEGLQRGWRSQAMSDVFIINPRIRATQTSYEKVTMGDLNERLATVFPSQRVSRPSGTRFEKDDVLLARITPSLENGKTGLVKFLTPGEIAVGSTEFIVLRGKVVGPAFAYCAARSDRVRDHAVRSMSGASGRQRVATDAFNSLQIVEPPPDVAEEFERTAGPWLDMGYELARQSQALAKTRDLLLPALVTGRRDVSKVALGLLLPSGSP